MKTIEINNYQLYNGDCLKFDIPKCRLLLTDIPYEVVNRNSNGLRNLNKDKADKKTFEILPFLNHIYNSFDVCIIFCGNEQYSTEDDIEHLKSENESLAGLDESF